MISVSPATVIWLIVLALLIVHTIASAILLYHWHQYGISQKVITSVTGIYIVLSTVLLGTLLFSAISFTYHV